MDQSLDRLVQRHARSGLLASGSDIIDNTTSGLEQHFIPLLAPD
jgi:hypothetical protein